MPAHLPQVAVLLCTRVSASAVFCVLHLTCPWRFRTGRGSQPKIPVADAAVVLAVVETEGVSLCTVLPVLRGLSL